MNPKIFEFIENSGELAVSLESSLTRTAAVSPDCGGEGELDKCLFLESFLRENGFKNLERIDVPDPRAKGGVRPNLVAEIAGSGASPDAGRLWIISHIDVVPPGELKLWRTNPWDVHAEGDRIYGRGVEDNQQGIVSSIIAALALLKAGVAPFRTLKLLFAADEECGSKFGIIPLLEIDGLFRSGDMALIPDGGDPLGETIEIAEKTILWIKFTTKGKQSHGSRPDEGANAFLAGCALALALRERLLKKFSRRDRLFTPDCSTFEPTKKEPNVPNINTIPGEDVFCMDMRVLPCYPLKNVYSEIEAVIKSIAEKHKVEIEYECVQAEQSEATPAGSPIVKLVEKAVFDILKVKTRHIGIGGGTVAGHLRNCGIDSVVWSKIEDNAHSPNESALISNLLDEAKVMAALALLPDLLDNS